MTLFELMKPTSAINPLTFQEIVEMIERGEITYAPSNRRKVLGSLRKCAELYGCLLASIPAQSKEFQVRWGKGVICTYPVGKFSSTKAFRTWRSNCLSAVKRAEQLRETTTTPELSEWTELLAAFESVAGKKAHGAKYEDLEGISIRILANIAQERGLPPQELTQDHLIKARAEAASCSQKGAIVRAVTRFDGLRGDPLFRTYMPPEPVGPLPPLRVLNQSAWNTLNPQVKEEWQSWLITRSTQQAPLSGATEQHSEAYLGQQQAAFKWYVRQAAALHLINPEEVQALRELVSTGTLATIVQDEERRRLNGSKCLSKNSLQSYVKVLIRLFQSLNANIDVSGYLRDPIFRSTGELAPRTQDFCKEILRSSTLQHRYFLSPDTLRERADELLAMQKTTSAIRFGICAFSMALLTRAAPLRRKNVVSICMTGNQPHLTLNRGNRIREIHFPAAETKNRKPIDLEVAPGRIREYLDDHFEWFTQRIRPLMLQRFGQISSPYLFPFGDGKHIAKGVWTEWMKRCLADIGLPITPHMVRHAAATLILGRHPDKLSLVAALLGDKPETVLKHYAFIDKAKRASTAQEHLLDDFFYHRKTRRNSPTGKRSAIHMKGGRK